MYVIFWEEKAWTNTYKKHLRRLRLSACIFLKSLKPPYSWVVDGLNHHHSPYQEQIRTANCCQFVTWTFSPKPTVICGRPGGCDSHGKMSRLVVTSWFWLYIMIIKLYCIYLYGYDQKEKNTPARLPCTRSFFSERTFCHVSIHADFFLLHPQMRAPWCWNLQTYIQPPYENGPVL